MAHDVFISYAKEDKSVADAVCRALEDKSIKCWYAPRDVPYSVNYEEAIIDAISGSSLILLILSAHANNSLHVKREIQNACNEQPPVPILPFQIEDIALNKALRYYLSSVQWLIAVTPPLEDHLEKLVGYMQTRLVQAKELKSSAEHDVEALTGQSVAEAEAARLREAEETRIAEESRLAEEKRRREAEEEAARLQAEEEERLRAEEERRKQEAEAAAALRAEEERRRREDEERREREAAEIARRREEEERQERERQAKERAEKERLEKERLEKERLKKEREEKERLEKERLEEERQAEERRASGARYREMNLAARPNQLDESAAGLVTEAAPTPVYKNKLVVFIALCALVGISIGLAAALSGGGEGGERQSSRQSASLTSTPQTSATTNLSPTPTPTPTSTPTPLPTPDKAAFLRKLNAYIKTRLIEPDNFMGRNKAEDVKVVYGDLNNDGAEDAASSYCLPLGRAAQSCELAVFVNENGNLTHLDTVNNEGSNYSWSLVEVRSINAGKIICSAWGGSGNKIQKQLALVGGKLKEVR